VRLFVADLVERVQAAEVAEGRAAAGAGGRTPRQARWVRLESLHLTLRFLGQVAEEALPAVRQAVEAAAGTHAPFRVAIGGGGAFPASSGPVRSGWASRTRIAGWPAWQPR
jgi:2'-5' RNA ligase